VKIFHVIKDTDSVVFKLFDAKIADQFREFLKSASKRHKPKWIKHIRHIYSKLLLLSWFSILHQVSWLIAYVCQ